MLFADAITVMMALAVFSSMPPSGVDGPVYAITNAPEALYVGGSFSAAGANPAANIARWDGSEWSALGSGTNGTVFALVVDENDLYAGGQFTNAGGIGVSNVARWDGSSWSDVGGGVAGVEAVVKSFAVDATGLLMGGIFESVGTATPANGLARWTGASWDVLGGIPLGIVHDIRAIVVTAEKIYVGGVLSFPGTLRPSEGTLSRATPAVLSNHAGSVNADDECFGCASVDALGYNGTDVYVGGAFTRTGQPLFVDSAYEIVRLANETTSVGMGGGTTVPLVSSNGAVNALAVVSDTVYVGGNITLIRSVSVSHVARWDGDAWSPLRGGVNGRTHALSIWNGMLYVGGLFTEADGEPANHIAGWDGSSWFVLGTKSTPVEVRTLGEIRRLFR